MTKTKAVDMTKTKAVELAGSVTALAKVLGVTQSAVSQWREIPDGRLYQLRVVRPRWFRKAKEVESAQ